METTNYSFLQGLLKSIRHIAVFGLGIAAVYAFAQYPAIQNTKIADLLSTVADKTIGGLTVGGAITLLINYLKNK